MTREDWGWFVLGLILIGIAAITLELI